MTETMLVSVMYVNNEIGSVKPVEEIGALIKRKNPKTIFHVDAIQAYGKYRIQSEEGAYRSAFSQRSQDPRPQGRRLSLYQGRKRRLFRLSTAAASRRACAPERDNVPGIAGLGVAAEKIYEDHEAKIARMYEIKEEFVEDLCRSFRRRRSTD